MNRGNYKPAISGTFTAAVTRGKNMRKDILILCVIPLLIGLIAFRVAVYFRARRVPLHEQTMRTAAEFITVRLHEHLAQHGTFPESLDELNMGVLPTGITTSHLARFTFSAHDETNSSGHRRGFVLERRFGPNNERVCTSP